MDAALRVGREVYAQPVKRPASHTAGGDARERLSEAHRFGPEAIDAFLDARRPRRGARTMALDAGTLLARIYGRHIHMSTYARHVAVGFAAALMLALAVGTASARNLSPSELSIRATWNPIGLGTEAATEVRCNLTLEGSFHSRTIPKVERTLVGFITRAIAGRPCSRNTGWVFNGTERNEALGNTTLPNSLPWHLTYERFTGTLPNPTSITFLLVNKRLLWRVNTGLGIILCTYTTSAANGIAAYIARLGAGGRVESLAADPTRRIRSENFGCPEIGLTGSATVTGLNNGNTISITLI
jgi:hypothetical protein